MATAWDSALRYLGQRDHSTEELRVKLSRRFEPEEVAEVMDRLATAELLDDAKFARRYAESLQKRGESRRSIAAKLKSKGIKAHEIERTLELYTDSDEFERAVELAARRLSSLDELPSDVKRRRLLAYLGRRGFSQQVCFAAMRKAEDGA